MLEDTIKKAKQRIEKTPFLFILLGIAVYFWINGEAHFPDWTETYGTVIHYYIIMLFVFLIFAKEKIRKQIQTPLSKSIQQYVLGFFATFALMYTLVLLNIFAIGEISPNILWQTLIIQICIVSVAEELMFRGVLLGYMGVLASSFLFMLWHSAAYGVLWYEYTPEMTGALIFAFLFGAILGFLVKYKPKSVGIIGAMSIHAAYNLIILGVLTV